MKGKIKMTYEDSIKRLDEIVKVLESGKLTLNEALDLYKEGVALSADCKKLLENARLQVETLSASEEE